MKRITEAREFDELRGAGQGFIYSDKAGNGPSGIQYNVLHGASCRMLRRATTNRPKYYGLDLGDARRWLNVNRGDNWVCCSVCLLWTQIP